MLYKWVFRFIDCVILMLKYYKVVQGVICGNKVIEDGEECDCGYKIDDLCKKDICCVGRDIKSKGSGCKRSKNVICRSVNYFIV